jgi:AraC family transcriptional regulator
MPETTGQLDYAWTHLLRNEIAQGSSAVPQGRWTDSRMGESQVTATMQVRIVMFPETRVAAINHSGAPSLEHDTVRKLVAWKLAHRLVDPLLHRMYGLHYTDPRASAPADHRVEFCLSYDGVVEPNEYGISAKIIPTFRCALARDIGSRLDNKAAQYLYHEWLAGSGEEITAQPLVFHYVNVGPNVKKEEAITDVYLPLKSRNWFTMAGISGQTASRERAQ